MLTLMLAGSGTCGKQNSPPYSSFVGPLIWKTGIMTWLMFKGSVPRPRLMYMSAVEWPANQPGCTPTAPPLTGHLVRFVLVGRPPPGEHVRLDKISSLFLPGRLTRIHPLHAIGIRHCSIVVVDPY